MILVRMGLLLRLGGGNVNYLILYMAVIRVLTAFAYGNERTEPDPGGESGHTDEYYGI